MKKARRRLTVVTEKPFFYHRKHLHLLRWGVEKFEDEEAASSTDALAEDERNSLSNGKCMRRWYEL